jgi:hypothetical protein
MTNNRAGDTLATAERWLGRELRKRIARIGTALAQEAENGREQADHEPQTDREAEQ